MALKTNRLTDVDDWRDEAVLEELHAERGWPATDIADHFNADLEDVRTELRQLGILEIQSPANHGLARKLWEMDPDAISDGERA